MERKEAEAIINAYDELVDKAVAILAGEGPPWGCIAEPQFAHLTLDGDIATITEPRVSTFYDSTCVEPEETTFPAELLFMSENELAEWKRLEKIKYEKDQAEKRAARLRENEAAERRALAALKAKYERA
jgi:hypothetical protein